ncbi:MAG TPA: transporter [Verrucomicrobiae bacterium]|nr:transporter [Verrucomicrobiae bacterium]
MLRLPMVFVFAFGGAVFAAENADKSKYHLFNSTPRELMREMSTDRPDKTESAYTVDAGHFQIESDLAVFEYDHDRSGGGHVHNETWITPSLNLKAGLCNFSDLQVVLYPYNDVRTHDLATGAVERHSGFGDVLTRLKVNLWGNDGGSCAGAVMPYVKWPTSQDNLGNHAIEGGVIIPVSFELPAGFSSAVMTQFDWVQDSGSKDYHPEFVNTITVSHKIVGDLDGFVEFFSLVSTESGAPWVGTLDLGLTYSITDDWVVDGGVYIGVTKSAPDVAPFIGMSFRY